MANVSSASGSLCSGYAIPPRKSNTRKSPFATARLASARSVPASNMPMPAKAIVPSNRRPTAAIRPPDASHPSAIPVTTIADRLHDLEREHVQRLRGQQPGAGERRGPEPLEHAVAALVSGCDAEAHHRARHHRQREHAGHEEVDGILQRRVDRVDLGEEHEDAERDRERDEQALGAPDREQHLDACLGGDRARLHSPTSPVRRRNTSSSEPCPARSSLEEHMLVFEPCGERGDERRARRHVDDVVARADLADLCRRQLECVRQLLDVESARRPRTACRHPRSW